MTRQAPTPNNQTDLDDDLDDLLGDEPEEDTEPSVAEEDAPPHSDAGEVPMAQVDAMLVHRADEDDGISIDDLLGDDDEDETAETPASPGTEEAAAFAEGADARAVADELDAEEAETAVAAAAPDPLNTGRLATAGTLAARLAPSPTPSRLLASLHRACETINRPTENLPPDLRNLVGYAGLVTLFVATLLIVGKILWIFFLAP